MDDRGYVAQALFDRLSGDRVPFRILGDSQGYPERAPPEVQLAVGRAALDTIPRVLGQFCRELDLQLVHLAPADARAWRCVLTWTDEVGHPRFMSARICSDYCRGWRCYLRAEELLSATPDTLFSHALIDAVEGGELAPQTAAWLCSQWNEDPRSAIERVARFWPDAASVRLIAQAAKHGEWTAVRAALGPLRRALRRAVWPEPADALARLAVLGRTLAQPAQAAVVFMGRESALRSAVLAQVRRDLAPLGLAMFEQGGAGPRAQLRIVFDSPTMKHHGDTVAVQSSQGLAPIAAAVERAILRWLECRVERRYPRALVGENPVAARVLQYAVRHRIPGVQFFMNCAIQCRLGSPVLMPYPFGIVIERNVSLGSRVTVMHQVSLLGEVTVEDNVRIGPGARVMGPVRIGRGATIGPNAVVTQDVPSHDTVVVEKRRRDRRTVVNV
jgi:Hexapeptide repeat of succinyl-transferase